MRTTKKQISLDSLPQEQRMAIGSLGSYFPKLTNDSAGFEEAMAYVRVLRTFFNGVSLPSEMYLLRVELKKLWVQADDDLLMAVIQNFIKNLKTKEINSQNITEYIPEIVLLAVLRYQFDTSSYSSTTIPELANRCIKFIKASAEIQKIIVTEFWGFGSTHDNDPELFEIALAVPGLLSKHFSTIKKDKVKQIQATIKALKSTDSNITHMQLENAILGKRALPEHVRKINDNVAASTFGQSSSVFSGMYLNFPYLMQLEWTTDALTAFEEIRKKFFYTIEKEKSKIVNEFKIRQGDGELEFSKNDTQFACRLLKISKTNILPESYFLDATLLILYKYQLVDELPKRPNADEIAQACILIIKIARFVEKCIDFNINNTFDRDRQIKCRRGYFLKIRLDINILQSKKKYSSLDEVEKELQPNDDDKRIEGELLQARNLRTLISFSPHYMKYKGASESNDGLIKIKNNIFGKIDFRSQAEFVTSLKEKLPDTLKDITKLLAVKIIPRQQKDEITEKNLAEYIPDIALGMIDRYKLLDLLKAPASIEETADMCIALIKAMQEVEEVLSQKDISAQSHEAYIHQMLPIALQVPGGLKKMKRMDEDSLARGRELIAKNVGKPSDQLQEMLFFMGSMSRKKDVLTGIGIVKIDKNQVEPLFDIYQKYQQVIDMYVARYKNDDGETPELAKKMSAAASLTAQYMSRSKSASGSDVAAMVFKVFLFYGDENQYIRSINFASKRIREDLIAVEKLKSLFVGFEDVFYLPVLLILHFSDQSNSGFLKDDKFYKIIQKKYFEKSDLYKLAQCIFRVQIDCHAETETFEARIWCEQIVQYFDTHRSDPSFHSMCFAVKILSEDKLLEEEEKSRLYGALIAAMVREELVLGNEIEQVSDLCTYYNICLKPFGHEDIGRGLPSSILIKDSIVFIESMGVEKYKEFEVKVLALFSAHAKSMEFHNKKNHIILLYAKYTGKSGKIKFLEKFINHINEDYTIDNFYEAISGAHMNVVAFCSRNNIDFYSLTGDERKKLLKAEMYFPGILSVENSILFDKNFIGNIKFIFKKFPMDDLFKSYADEEDYFSESNVLERILVRAQVLGLPLHVLLEKISKNLRFGDDFDICSENLKKIKSNNLYKYEYILRLFSCYIEHFLIIDEYKNSDLTDTEFQQRVIYAASFSLRYPDARNEAFKIALYYPDVASYCTSVHEIKSMDTLINSGNQLPEADLLNILLLQLYTKNKDLIVQLIEEFDTSIKSELPAGSSTSSSMHLWKGSTSDKRKGPDSITNILSWREIQIQLDLHVRSIELIRNSSLDSYDKLILQMCLVNNLKYYLQRDDRYDMLVAEQVSTLESVCRKFGFSLMPVLTFDNDRELSDFEVNGQKYTKHRLAGGKGQKNEWNSEFQNKHLSRIGFIYAVNGRLIWPSGKLFASEDEFKKSVYLNTPNEQQYQWHQDTYGLYDTTIPFLQYPTVTSLNVTFHLRSEQGKGKTGLFFEKNAISSLRYDHLQSTDPSFPIDGSTYCFYELRGEDGYFLTALVHEGDAYYIDYARLSYFYSDLFRTHYTKEVSSWDDIKQNIDEQIAVLKAADMLYQAFYEPKPLEMPQDALSKIKKIRTEAAIPLPCIDNVNGRPRHRAMVENWLAVFHHEDFLITQMLYHYSHLFDSNITQKSDLPAALYRFSKSQVKSLLQIHIFSVLKAYLSGYMNEADCLNLLLEGQKYDFRNAHEGYFDACKKRLNSLKDDDRQLKLYDMVLPAFRLQDLNLSPVVLQSVEGVGTDRDKIVTTMLKIARECAAFFIFKDKKILINDKLTTPFIASLLSAYHEVMMVDQVSALSKDRKNYILQLSMQYPGFIARLPNDLRHYAQIERIIKRAEQDFTGMITTDIICQIASDEHYRDNLLSSLGINKAFSDKPITVKTRKIQDKILWIYFEIGGLGNFFSKLTSEKIPFERYQKMLDVRTLSIRYCKLLKIKDEAHRNHIFSMLLHSEIYFENDTAQLINLLNLSKDNDFIQIVNTGQWKDFIQHHQKINEALKHSNFNLMSRDEKILFENQIIEFSKIQPSAIVFFMGKINNWCSLWVKFVKSLHEISLIIPKDKFKKLLEQVLTIKNNEGHVAINLFNFIQKQTFMDESERRDLYLFYINQFEKLNHNQIKALNEISKNDDIYPFLLMFNRNDLILKYKHLLRSKLADRNIEISPKDEMPAIPNTLTPQAALERITIIYANGINPYELLRVIHLHSSVVKEYLFENSYAHENIMFLIKTNRKVLEYIEKYPTLDNLKDLLFFISIYNVDFMQVERNQEEIRKFYREIILYRKLKIKGEDISKMQSFEKDMGISIERLMELKPLWTLVDIYCDDLFKDTLIAYVNKNDNNYENAYYNAVNAFKIVKHGPKHYQLLLCSLKFNEHIKNENDVEKLHQYFALIHSNENSNTLSELDKYYLVFLFKKKDFVVNAFATMTDETLKRYIPLAIYLSILNGEIDAINENISKAVMSIKVVYESHLSIEMKQKIYQVIVANSDKFSVDDDLATVCEKAGYHYAYQNLVDDEIMSIVAHGVNPKDANKKLIRLAEKLELYMKDGFSLYWGERNESQPERNYIRMLYAFYKHEKILAKIFEHVKYDFEFARDYDLFNRIIQADYMVSQFIKKHFVDIPEIQDRLFKLEIAFPGVILYALEFFPDLDEEPSDADYISWLKNLLTAAEKIIDLDDPHSLIYAITYKDEMKCILAEQSRKKNFFRHAERYLKLADFEKSDHDREGFKMMLPKLFYFCHKYYCLQEFFKKIEKPNAADYHYVISILTTIEKIKQTKRIHEEIIDREKILFLLNNPAFLNTVYEDDRFKRIDYALTLNNKLDLETLFSVQFLNKNEDIEKFIKNKNKKFIKHLIAYIDVILKCKLEPDVENNLLQKLAHAFMNNGGAFSPFNPSMQNILSLAGYEYSLSFTIPKSESLKISADVLEQYKNVIVKLVSNNDHYSDVHFAAGVDCSKLTLTANSIKIPAYLIEHPVPEEKTKLLLNDESKHYRYFYLNVNSLYMREIPSGAVAHGAFILNVADNAGFFTVTASGPNGMPEQAMAILTVYDSFVRQFLDKVPGVSYLQMGRFEAPHRRFFDKTNTHFYDYTMFNVRQQCIQNYNFLNSGLCNIAELYQGRERNDVLKLNFAARLFNDGLALYQLIQPDAVTDVIEGNRFIRHINVYSLQLHSILNNLLTFDSIRYYKKGVFNAENLQLIAQLFGLKYDVAVDNLATLLCRYHHGFRKSPFANKLSALIGEFMCGKHTLKALLEKIKAIGDDSAINEMAKEAFLENIYKITLRQDKHVHHEVRPQATQVLSGIEAGVEKINRILKSCFMIGDVKPSNFIARMHVLQQPNQTFLTQFFSQFSVYHTYYSDSSLDENNELLHAALSHENISQADKEMIQDWLSLCDYISVIDAYSAPSHEMTQHSRTTEKSSLLSSAV